MTRPVLRTPLCDVLGVEYPVLQAGMGSHTTPQLVAAVSNAGGLGVLGAGNTEPEHLQAMIRAIRSLTQRPFGVDVLFPAVLAEVTEDWKEAKARIAREHPEHVAFVQKLSEQFGIPDAMAEAHPVENPVLKRQQVEVVFEERVPVLAAALGDPAWAIPEARSLGIKVMGLAGSLRNAIHQVEAGVDIIIAQGTEGGGHTGRVATLPLVRQVVEAVSPVPVVAAGGIGDGHGLVAALALGAQGVWCGTLFLTAKEASIYPRHQRQILEGDAEDFVISRAWTGKTNRHYKNPISVAWEKSGLPPLPRPLQALLLEDFVAGCIRVGRLDLVHNPAGQVGGILNRKKPAGQIVEEMVIQAVDILTHRFGEEVVAKGGRFRD